MRSSHHGGSVRAITLTRSEPVGTTTLLLFSNARSTVACDSVGWRRESPWRSHCAVRLDRNWKDGWRCIRARVARSGMNVAFPRQRFGPCTFGSRRRSRADRAARSRRKVGHVHALDRLAWIRPDPRCFRRARRGRGQRDRRVARAASLRRGFHGGLLAPSASVRFALLFNQNEVPFHRFEGVRVQAAVRRSTGGHEPHVQRRSQSVDHVRRQAQRRDRGERRRLVDLTADLCLESEATEEGRQVISILEC